MVNKVKNFFTSKFKTKNTLDIQIKGKNTVIIKDGVSIDPQSKEGRIILKKFNKDMLKLDEEMVSLDKRMNSIFKEFI